MDIITQVKNLNLPKNQYIVAGSGIMTMHGLKQANDIDIIVSLELFEKCEKEGWNKMPYTYPDKLGQHYLQKGDVELYLDVNHGEEFRPTLEELLSRAKIFDGVPFLSMEDLLKFKRSYNRPKDQSDIEKIENFLRK